MSSENPEIRHPSILDSGDTEHASTNIAAFAGEEEKVLTKLSFPTYNIGEFTNLGLKSVLSD